MTRKNRDLSQEELQAEIALAVLCSRYPSKVVEAAIKGVPRPGAETKGGDTMTTKMFIDTVESRIKKAANNVRNDD